MDTTLPTDLHRVFWVDPIKLEIFDITAARLLELIFLSLRVTVDAELSLEWFKAIAIGTTDMVDIWAWINNNFSPPLHDEIVKFVEKEYDYAFKSLKQGLRRYKSWIYRGIVSYIYNSALRNVQLHGVNGTLKEISITPWDLINILTDENGDSLIRAIQFPTKTVSVSWRINNIIYDVNLDQFMGMILAVYIINDDTANTRYFNIIRYVTIYEVTVPYIEFMPRVLSYLYHNEDEIYSLKIKTNDMDGNISFNSLDFIAGFIIPFSWINEDHHKYWTEFKQWNDPQFPNGKLLEF